MSHISLEKGDPLVVARVWNGMKYHTCQYCGPLRGLPSCDEFGPDELICTREKGHEGPHIACGATEHSHPVGIWENTEANA